ncbi:MAG: hypothetical protein EBZ77_16785, partial [Chitinophagia bacterium]|nr:hypothetical protein [Chitinophagia bacterium]
MGRVLDWPPGTVRYRCHTLGIKPSVPSTGKPQEIDTATRSVTSDDPAEWGDARQLIARRGLDPDQWLIVRCRVNEWTQADGTLATQLRVDLEPRASL